MGVMKSFYVATMKKTQGRIGQSWMFYQNIGLNYMLEEVLGQEIDAICSPAFIILASSDFSLFIKASSFSPPTPPRKPLQAELGVIINQAFQDCACPHLVCFFSHYVLVTIKYRNMRQNPNFFLASLSCL